MTQRMTLRASIGVTSTVASLFFLMGANHAHAQVTMNILTGSGVPGSTITFKGEITNSSAGRVYLNDVANILNVPGLTLRDNLFFENAPAFLDPGTSTGNFSLFAVDVDPTMALGTYTGDFTLKGGGGIDSVNILRTTSFSVRVVPAPGAIMTVVIGALFPAASLLKRKRSRRKQV